VTLDLLCSGHESNFASRVWNITLEIPHLGEMSVKILENDCEILACWAFDIVLCGVFVGIEDFGAHFFDFGC
jgi:hypothetical protein